MVSENQPLACPQNSVTCRMVDFNSPACRLCGKLRQPFALNGHSPL